MVTAIGAIIHATSQRADLVRFYRDGLGLGDPDHLRGEELFQVGDLCLGVGSGEGRPRGVLPRLGLTFIVDDLEGQVAHLKGLGIPFDVEPTPEASGARRAVCRDPDGNFVTLLSGPRQPGARRGAHGLGGGKAVGKAKASAKRPPGKASGRVAPKARTAPKAGSPKGARQAAKRTDKARSKKK